MDWMIDALTAKTLLHQYSEWLDAEQGLMVSDADDPRSHEDLVRDFLEGRVAEAKPKVVG